MTTKIFSLSLLDGPRPMNVWSGSTALSKIRYEGPNQTLLNEMINKIRIVDMAEEKQKNIMDNYTAKVEDHHGYWRWQSACHSQSHLSYHVYL